MKWHSYSPNLAVLCLMSFAVQFPSNGWQLAAQPGIGLTFFDPPLISIRANLRQYDELRKSVR